MLGWGADYPDMTNFLDFHFGAGATAQFGDKFDDLTAALTEGASGTSDAARKPAYEKANNLIQQHVPMIPMVNGGSAVAYKADVTDAARLAAGQRVLRRHEAGRPRPVRLDAERRARRPLLRRRVGRRVAARLRADARAALRLRDRRDGGRAGPRREVRAERRLDRPGPARCARASSSPTAPPSTPTTWSSRTAVQWDAADPLHKGRDSSFSYFPGLFGGFLNPPPPAE